MRIKQIRSELKMSQAELARRCGVTQAAISKYEDGKREPSLAMLKKIAAVLGVSVDELIKDIAP